MFDCLVDKSRLNMEHGTDDSYPFIASLTILKGYEEASKELFTTKLHSVCTSGEQLAKPDLILLSYPTICLFGDYSNTFGTNKAVQLRTPASQPPSCRLG